MEDLIVGIVIGMAVMFFFTEEIEEKVTTFYEQVTDKELK